MELLFAFIVTLMIHRSKIQAQGSLPEPTLPSGLPHPSQTRSTVHALTTRNQTSAVGLTCKYEMI